MLTRMLQEKNERKKKCTLMIDVASQPPISGMDISIKIMSKSVSCVRLHACKKTQRED